MRVLCTVTHVTGNAFSVVADGNLTHQFMTDDIVFAPRTPAEREAIKRPSPTVAKFKEGDKVILGGGWEDTPAVVIHVSATTADGRDFELSYDVELSADFAPHTKGSRVSHVPAAIMRHAEPPKTFRTGDRVRVTGPPDNPAIREAATVTVGSGERSDQQVELSVKMGDRYLFARVAPEHLEHIEPEPSPEAKPRSDAMLVADAIKHSVAKKIMGRGVNDPNFPSPYQCDECLEVLDAIADFIDSNTEPGSECTAGPIEFIDDDTCEPPPEPPAVRKCFIVPNPLSGDEYNIYQQDEPNSRRATYYCSRVATVEEAERICEALEKPCSH
jgi:hypothetical protein